MKLTSKLLIATLLLSSIQARDVLLVTYEKETDMLQFIQTFMKKKIDENMIEYKKVNEPCKYKSKEAILHLCLTKNDNLLAVSAKNNILRNTFADFTQ